MGAPPRRLTMEFSHNHLPKGQDMKYDFTEENLGANFELLEQLMTQLIAQHLALREVIQHSPELTSRVQHLALKVEDQLMPHQISDQSIALVRWFLTNLSSPVASNL